MAADFFIWVLQLPVSPGYWTLAKSNDGKLTVLGPFAGRLAAWREAIAMKKSANCCLRVTFQINLACVIITGEHRPVHRYPQQQADKVVSCQVGVADVQ